MSVLARHFALDPQAVFLNHGSFGSCPRAVLDVQAELRAELERRPVDFMMRTLERRLDAVRERLAQFCGAQPEDLVLVPNATAGVNSVLRSLPFAPGDELLVTDHEYAACRNVLDFVAERAGARVVVARIPFPLASPDDAVTAVLAEAGPRTRLALVDHVTSQTALVLPIERIVRELDARGIDTLVDGAHAPGMLALDVGAIGAAWYTGNCHKWLCAPKGAGFLHVRRDRQQQVRPWLISHGASSTRRDRSLLQVEFGWTGTWDPTAMLCIPAAIDHLESLVPGGWPALRARNHALVVEARALLCAMLGIDEPCPRGMLGSMASLPLPDGTPAARPRSVMQLDPWQEALHARWGIEVPVIEWPGPPRRLVRISAQVYNTLPQYRLLGAALRDLALAASGQKARSKT